jgi:putative molybdopterin biosynthesis protein
VIGQRVRLGRVGGALLAMDMADAFRPFSAADGIVARGIGPEGEVEVSLVQHPPPAPDLIVAGCDPAFQLVADILRREHGVEVHYRQMGSRSALEALARGECHIAGSHLPRPDSPVDVDWIKDLVPFPCTRVACAIWEQGLLVKSGNPLGVGGVADLARPEVRFLNRERGSGSRALLDERLSDAGVRPDSVTGYASAARGHLAVAEAIAVDLADAGVAIRAAGRSFGLDVIPLVQERYELVIPNHFLDLPATREMLKLFRRGSVRDQFEALDGYDCRSMGEIL